MTTALFTLQEFATVTKTGHEGGGEALAGAGIPGASSTRPRDAQPPALGCLSNGNEFPRHLYPAINIGKPYNKLPPLTTPSSHLPATSHPQFMVVVGRWCGGRAVCIRLGMYDPTVRHCGSAHVLISTQHMPTHHHLPFFLSLANNRCGSGPAVTNDDTLSLLTQKSLLEFLRLERIY
ncbi:hypothetical protein E2C01_003333 [Portunus trituberculatus]|uniref:Uncharacterized protein n=1 Tax=Portunus trituberculatus TaxID=210409 RepID=A0A5B7CLX6_PORTR|nr:hypothetical protein [Portunus trituberculatus]